MRRLLWLVIGSLLPLQVCAQGVGVPPRMLIDTPAAGVLPPAGFDFSMRAYGNGGLLVDIAVGVSTNFMFGVSYGGTNVLGNGKVNWNQNPGVSLRYQLLSESYGVPGVTIGFDSQGYGAFIDSTKRYENKSPGFFAVASKSYDLFDRLDLHGGINFSLETEDKDRDPNVFIGATLAFNHAFEMLWEYDVALNDNVDGSINSGKGYLNMGGRLNVRNTVYIEFFIKDLLENRKNIANANRELKVTYFQFIQ